MEEKEIERWCVRPENNNARAYRLLCRVESPLTAQIERPTNKPACSPAIPGSTCEMYTV